jgi:hypothetical protein
MDTASLVSIPNDATGQVVESWVKSQLQPLNAFVQTTTVLDGSVTVHECIIPDSMRPRAAWRCAVEIAANRLKLHPSKFFAWYCQLTTGSTPDAKQRDRAADRLLVDIGSPDKPKDDAHLCGLVGETLLGHLLCTNDRGLGLPVLFEGHDWSVSDPGGDCLAVYKTATGHCFRLWECKSIYGTTATGTVVRGAAEQLHRRAAEYLGRFQPVAQRADLSPDVVDFILALEDLWLDDDPAKGAGISVASHSSKRVAGCFSEINTILGLDSDRTHGNFAAASDFLGFCKDVRAHIWTGAGLWKMP